MNRIIFEGDPHDSANYDSWLEAWRGTRSLAAMVDEIPTDGWPEDASFDAAFLALSRDDELRRSRSLEQNLRQGRNTPGDYLAL